MLPNCASAIRVMPEAFFHATRTPANYKKIAACLRNIMKESRLPLPHFKEMVI
jgi:hypothetical protein